MKAILFLGMLIINFIGKADLSRLKVVIGLKEKRDSHLIIGEGCCLVFCVAHRLFLKGIFYKIVIVQKNTLAVSFGSVCDDTGLSMSLSDQLMIFLFHSQSPFMTKVHETGLGAIDL